MKRPNINLSSFVIIILFITLFGLSGCMASKQYLEVIRLDEEPENFVNVSEQQMKDFPHLNEAIKFQDEFIDTPYEEFYRLRDFLEDEETKVVNNYIKYKDEYYKIRFFDED